MIIKFKPAAIPIITRNDKGEKIRIPQARLFVYFIDEGIFGEEITKAADAYAAQFNDAYVVDVEVRSGTFPRTTAILVDAPADAEPPPGAILDLTYG